MIYLEQVPASFARVFPPAIGHQGTGWYNKMKMGMKREVLTPAVQYGSGSYSSANPLFGLAKILQNIPSDTEQQVIHCHLVV
jgi:hypothetical protein